MTTISPITLRDPFPPTKIQQIKQAGMTLDYVGHADITERLLDVDPAWTWEPVAFDETGLPAFDSDGGLWIKLTVCGVTRYGYGPPQGRNTFDAKKGAIGNALRNAAMRFGVALQLWQKDQPAHEYTPADVIESIARKGTDQPRLKSEGHATPKQLLAILNILKRAGITDDAAQVGTLSNLLQRTLTEVADIRFSEVDECFKAGVEGMKAARDAWQGFTVEPRVNTVEDDPWAGETLV